ncbi:Hypothetical_protein [Hexamita inflata]|uniref:Hypothetical_protein n=1 Tax=Hexamita inflata TaxID=28002 RepID=A0AA86RL39_9EUKA|nr:Hypothetical protein HINF_LOCUS64468 [Hexamita inflata]
MNTIAQPPAVIPAIATMLKLNFAYLAGVTSGIFGVDSLVYNKPFTKESLLEFANSFIQVWLTYVQVHSGINLPYSPQLKHTTAQHVILVAQAPGQENGEQSFQLFPEIGSGTGLQQLNILQKGSIFSRMSFVQHNGSSPFSYLTHLGSVAFLAQQQSVPLIKIVISSEISIIL